MLEQDSQTKRDGAWEKSSQSHPTPLKRTIPYFAPVLWVAEEKNSFLRSGVISSQCTAQLTGADQSDGWVFDQTLK